MKNRFLSPSLKMLIALTLAYSLGSIHAKIAAADDENKRTLKTYSKDEISQIFEKLVVGADWDIKTEQMIYRTEDAATADGEVKIILSGEKTSNNAGTLQLYNLLQKIIEEKHPTTLPDSYVDTKATLKQKSVTLLIPPAMSGKASAGLLADPVQALQSVFRDIGANADFMIYGGYYKKDTKHPRIQYSFSALQLAAMTEDVKIVELFLEQGAEASSDFGRCTSHEDIKKLYEINKKLFDAKTLEETQAALNEGASLTTRWFGKQTVLDTAVMDNNLEKVQFLITKDKSLVDVKDSHNRTVLYWAVTFSRSPEIVSALLDSNKNLVSMADDGGNLPLHEAATAFRIDKEMLEMIYNAYPEALMKQNNAGETPASLAARDPWGVLTFDFLFSKASDKIGLLKTRCKDGQTIFGKLLVNKIGPRSHEESEKLFETVINVLKNNQKEANDVVNAMDQVGQTPLHYLVLSAMMSNYNALFDPYGIKDEETLAKAKENNLKTAKMLLDLGADPSIKNKLGQSALSLAETNGIDELADLLNEYAPTFQPRRRQGRGRRPAFTKRPAKTIARKKQ